MAVDTGKLEEFPGRFIADPRTTVAADSVVIGHRLAVPSASRRACHRRRTGGPHRH
jgi:hypothetical protein